MFLFKFNLFFIFFCSKQNKSELKNDTPELKTTNKAILPDECRQYLKNIYQHNAEVLTSIFPVLKHCSKNVNNPTDVFFFDVIPVIPSTVRPVRHSFVRIYKELF